MADRGRMARGELGTLIARIEKARPRASLLYARLIMALMDAPERTMKLSDLSHAIGRGRDSTAVQTAVTLLCDLGLASREMCPAEGDGGRYYLVRLNR